MTVSRSGLMIAAKERKGMDLLERLLDHDRWMTLRFLELSRGLTDAQLDQPFDLGHQTLRATFAHIIGAIDFWVGLFTGQPVETELDDRSLAALTDGYKRS